MVKGENKCIKYLTGIVSTMQLTAAQVEFRILSH